MTDTVRIIVHPAPGLAMPGRLHLDCNGRTIKAPYGTEIDLPTEFLEVLANSSARYELVAHEAAAAGVPGGNAGGSAPDPEPEPEPEPVRDPLDHDGDGRKGGSLPKKKGLKDILTGK